MNSKVSYAVAAILSGMPLGAIAATSGAQSAAATSASASTATSQTDSSEVTGLGALTEIVVTAQRRRQDIQDVPITMRALSGRALRQLNVQTFQDYIRMLPNITSANNGPGQNQIFMRGVSAGSQSSQGSASTGLWPNVAVYLDNQSVQLPNHNLDIYLADINRIEVLEGPQGTLFGSGAEAGAIRYITNKPQLDKFGGDFTASYGVTAHGDPNTAVTGVINLPIIPRHFAMRFVVYNDRRGGYIDNVPAQFARKNTDIGIHYANFPAVNGQCPDGQPNNGYCVPPGSPVITNTNIARNNINPVTYQGGRAEALYRLNDDWNVLISQMYQNLDAEGVFYQQPLSSDGQPLQPLQVTLFTPAYNHDRFSNTAWTVHGKLDRLSVIYTGGLLTRNVETQSDYTNYARGVYADYYQCFGPGTGYDNSLTSTCFTPRSPVHSDEQNRHWQHELRVQTPSDWRTRGIAGVYYEDDEVWDQTDWRYRHVPTCTSNAPAGSAGNTGCFATVGTFPGTTVKFPGLQTGESAFYQDTFRQVRQIAEFASVSYDLIPHELTLTAGTRHFLFLNSSAGSVMSSFGCFEGGAPPGGCQSAYSFNLNAEHLSDSESGWRSRANISWHIHPTLAGHRQSIMTYFTFSQGFRPGGFNQNGGSLHGYGPDGQPQFVVPKSYQSDSLNDYEVGWKSDWMLFNRRFQWNGAVYRENWQNVQISFFDPGVVGNIFFNTNGQNFRIDGVETSFAAQIWRGLTLRGTGAWNSSEQQNSPALIDQNPQSVNFGKPITQECDASGGNCQPITNPFGPRGAPTADSPPVHFTLMLRYDFEAPFGYLAHVQFGVEHTGHSYTQAGTNPPFVPGVTISTARLRFEDPAYTTYDASLGVSKDNWYFNAYGENLTDSNAAVFTSTDDFIVAQTPLRPRVLGVRFGYHF